MVKLVDVLGESGRRCCIVDRKEVLTRYATGSSAAIPTYSDAEAAQQVGVFGKCGRCGELIEAVYLIRLAGASIRFLPII